MAKLELASTLRNLQFMQRAARREEVIKKEEVKPDGNFTSHGIVTGKCMVIMEGDPHPGAIKGRMSFQSLNPSIDNSSKNKCLKFNREESSQKPTCNKCGKTHLGECRAGTTTCYKCGNNGHFIKDCLERNEGQKKTNAQLFALTKEDAKADSSVVSGELLTKEDVIEGRMSFQSFNSSIDNNNRKKRKKFNRKESSQKPTCNKCGRTHSRECRAGTKSCYKCGKGHFIKDCPELGRGKKKSNAWLFTLTKEDTKADPSEVSSELLTKEDAIKGRTYFQSFNLSIDNNNMNKRLKFKQEESSRKATCNKCGRTHPGECRAGTTTCYKCGKEGHFIKDCPELDEGQRNTNVRLFMLTKEDAKVDPSVVSGAINFDDEEEEWGDKVSSDDGKEEEDEDDDSSSDDD